MKGLTLRLSDSNDKKINENRHQADIPNVNKRPDHRWVDVFDINNLESEYPDSFCLQVLMNNKLKNAMPLYMTSPMVGIEDDSGADMETWSEDSHEEA